MIALIATLTAMATVNPPLRIGSLHADSPNGVAVVASPEASAVFRIGWYEDGKLLSNYEAVSEPSRKLRFGPASPDGSFGSLSWGIKGGRLEIIWARKGDSIYMSVRTTCPAKVAVEGVPFHDKSRFSWSGMRGEKQGKIGDLKFHICGDRGEVLGAHFEAMLAYETDKNLPVFLAIGIGQQGDATKAEATIRQARSNCLKKHPSSQVGWSDFLGALITSMNQNQTYSPENDMVAHTVSRGWCRPDGQVLFCWDSFFNGLLASVGDKESSQRTIRAVLAAQVESGFIANFSGRPWGVSSDRSQPPVGSMCIWKMHQRWPEKAFLKEVYPKLVKWHDWWFSKRANGKATRDGDGNGLLEWGSETGQLQDAKFESGLDDSPMFDGAGMNGPNMTMDSVDLNALWAMDADYLARIASALGKKEDAKRFEQECSQMNDRISKLLWDDEIGMFCNKHWVPRIEQQPLEPGVAFKTPLKGQYYKGRNFEELVVEREDKKPGYDPNTLPDGLGPNDFSIRWTGKFTAPKAGKYTFTTDSDDGVRVWLDGKLVIENWDIHAPEKDSSPEIELKEGQTIDLKVEYFQAEGGATLNLSVVLLDPNAKPKSFNERLAPCNFYPLITGVLPKDHSKRIIDTLLDPNLFWGEYVCPTIARNDPAFPNQHYWRGKIWGPANYLMWLGLKRYAPENVRRDFAEKCVKLFMKNWTENGTCNENFLSSGEGSSDPHYTWGALLCLIGLEEIVDVEPDGQVRLNGTWNETMDLHGVPIGGKRYDIEVRPGLTRLMQGKKVVAEAKGEAKVHKLGD